MISQSLHDMIWAYDIVSYQSQATELNQKEIGSWQAL